MLSAKGNKDSISAPIIKIAIAAVAIGMVIMLVAVSTGVGLQKKNQRKSRRFQWSHPNFQFRQQQLQGICQPHFHSPGFLSQGIFEDP